MRYAYNVGKAAPEYCAQCVLIEGTDFCDVCDAYHGDPCAACGQRAYHLAGCPLSDDSSEDETGEGQ